MKILFTEWFTAPDGCYGIVVGEVEETGERKAYLGKGFGQDAEVDANHIAQNGAKVHLGSIQNIFNNLKK